MSLRNPYATNGATTYENSFFGPTLTTYERPGFELNRDRVIEQGPYANYALECAPVATDLSMTEEATELLRRLEICDAFSLVGKTDLEVPTAWKHSVVPWEWKPVVQCPDLKTAMAIVAADSTLDLLRCVAEMMRHRVAEHFDGRFDLEWTSRVAQFDPAVNRCLPDQLRRCPLGDERTIVRIAEVLKLIALHSLLEECFPFLIASPGFFRRLFEYHLEGRLVCGFMGWFDDTGVPVVY